MNFIKFNNTIINLDKITAIDTDEDARLIRVCFDKEGGYLDFEYDTVEEMYVEFNDLYELIRSIKN